MLIETPGGFDYTGADYQSWMRDAGLSPIILKSFSIPLATRCSSAAAVEGIRLRIAGGGGIGKNARRYRFAVSPAGPKQSVTDAAITLIENLICPIGIAWRKTRTRRCATSVTVT